mgnify:CR=1 FL=1
MRARPREDEKDPLAFPGRPAAETAARDRAGHPGKAEGASRTGVQAVPAAIRASGDSERPARRPSGAV